MTNYEATPCCNAPAEEVRKELGVVDKLQEIGNMINHLTDLSDRTYNVIAGTLPDKPTLGDVGCITEDLDGITAKLNYLIRLHEMTNTKLGA